jgi:Protein of unknown function (DUF3021)
MTRLATLRNILIVCAIAAVVDLVPGGGTGATLVSQAASLLFLGALGWFASIMYRQRRLGLYALGDTRRTILYVAIGVAAVTLTGTNRLWADRPLGSIVWLVLMGASFYAVFAVIWSSRRS